MLLLAFYACISQVQLPCRLFPSFWIFFRERTVTCKLSQESSLAFCILPSRTSFRLICRMLGVFLAERAVSFLFFWHFHRTSLTGHAMHFYSADSLHPVMQHYLQ